MVDETGTGELNLCLSLILIFPAQNGRVNVLVLGCPSSGAAAGSDGPLKCLHRSIKNENKKEN